MPVAYYIIASIFRQHPGFIRVVVHRHRFAIELTTEVFTVDVYLRKFLRIINDRHNIAVVIAQHDVDGLFVVLLQQINDEGRAEVAAAKHYLGGLQIWVVKGFFQVPDVVVDLSESMVKFIINSVSNSG